MPTGFTEDLCKKDVPFEKFVLNCARACIGSMRDSSGPLPERFSPPTYYRDEIRKDQAKLAALKAMTAAEVEDAADRDYTKALQEREKYVAEVKERRERLMAMRTRVAAWLPPTRDHEGLRQFMIEQLDLTLKHDGEVLGDPPEKTTAKEWKANRIAYLEDEIASNEESQRKAVRDAEHDTLWVERLRDNLDMLARDLAPFRK